MTRLPFFCLTLWVAAASLVAAPALAGLESESSSEDGQATGAENAARDANNDNDDDDDDESDGGSDDKAKAAPGAVSSSDAAESDTSSWGRNLNRRNAATFSRRDARDAGARLITERDQFIQDHGSKSRLKKYGKIAARLESRKAAAALGSAGNAFSRREVGGVDGVIAQHMVNIFASYPGASNDAAAHAQTFVQIFKSGTVTEFQQNLLAAKTQFSSSLNDNSLSDVELARLQQGLDSVDALLQEIKDFEVVLPDPGKESGRAELASAMNGALRAAGSGFFDNLTTDVEIGDMRLSQLNTRGGKNAKVYEFKMDWDKDEGGPVPENELPNAIFKPDGALTDGERVEGVGLPNNAALRLGIRQELTYEIAKLLGQEVLVVRTQYVNFGPHRGVVQEMASGKPPFDQFYDDVPEKQQDGTDNPEYKTIVEAFRTVEAGVDVLVQRGMTQADAAQAVADAQGSLDFRGDVKVDEVKNADGEPGPPRVRKLVREEATADFNSAKDTALMVRNLANAEILDLLCGQLDRNAGNFFIRDFGGLKLIDSDQAFGLNTDPWSAGNASTLPPKASRMDGRMGEALLNLDSSVLLAATAGKLTSQEQDALIERLNALKAHAQELKDAGRWIPDTGLLVASEDWVTHKADFSNKFHYYGSIAGS